jgi:hypothetical protein
VCILCYGLVGDEHWTDIHVGPERAASVRARRRRMMTQVLAAQGLDYSEAPSGVTSLIGDRKGNVAIAGNLGEVWAVCERLAGRPLDPLDPGLLRRLASQPPAR